MEPQPGAPRAGGGRGQRRLLAADGHGCVFFVGWCRCVFFFFFKKNAMRVCVCVFSRKHQPKKTHKQTTKSNQSTTTTINRREGRGGADGCAARLGARGRRLLLLLFVAGGGHGRRGTYAGHSVGIDVMRWSPLCCQRWRIPRTSDLPLPINQQTTTQPPPPRPKTQVKWEAYPTPAGRGLALRLGGEASFVRWHSKGDYLASVVPNGGARAVMIHQVGACVSG